MGRGLRRGPGVPSLKSRPQPELLFLWRAGHVIDGGAALGAQPRPRPAEPRRGGGGVPTWKLGTGRPGTVGRAPPRPRRPGP